jgi:methionyl-tRNA formyltransferase
MAGRFLDVRHVLESGRWEEWKDRLETMEGEFVLNLLSDRILKGAILKRQTVNFHPAPPEYPGCGTASYAIFDGASSFGATAHIMADKPDSGAILKVKRFPILETDGCENLAGKAEAACLELMAEIAAHIQAEGALPSPNGEAWQRKAFTRKEFQEWLILDPADPETFERKIRAARHSRYPGPYVYVNGRRFSLAES